MNGIGRDGFFIFNRNEHFMHQPQIDVTADFSKRDVVRTVLQGGKPPYVPWSMGFTAPAREKLISYFGTEDVDSAVGNHILRLGSDIGFFDELGNDRFRDVFGVVWNRSVDRDIGIVEGQVLAEPTLDGRCFPNPHDDRFFRDIPGKIARHPDRFRVFQIGFSLYERAWTLRGMEPLMRDFIMNPEFVDQLFDAICEYNIAQVNKAIEFDVDAVYFGDDWGQQHGLQMGPKHWKRFILPRLCRMYSRVRDAGKFVMIHSCGDVDAIFPDLVEAGLNCFNPFQPEVMDVQTLLPTWRGRMAFHGGLSTQRTMPFGTSEDVREETQRLLESGADGGYIFAPAHDVAGDVPLENMLAAIETVQSQVGFARHKAEI